ncbi:MAG: 2-amino-4-hydroxy-6-hydroxymethyldihydropteridine diphosphokinase [Granulosicoccaceae bacterium]|jgi:2-amino-4-hydroxy-6-hydroxymethyldihydropteridine diphosphokinase
MVVCYIGLGSNLDQPVQQLQQAFDELAALPATRLQAQSSLYRSAPLGPAGQPDYINAVAELHTELSAHALLDALQAIEQTHQRVRTQRWGPRTLDLDILLYGDAQIDDARLQVPHPAIAGRAFVLYPLAEIAPQLHIPGLGAITDLLGAVAGQELERLRVDEDSLPPNPLQ